ARLIALLGSRFPPFASASNRTSLCGFMLLSGDNLRRAQPILSLLPPRRLRPSVIVSREQTSLGELKSAAVSTSPIPRSWRRLLGAAASGAVAPLLFTQQLLDPDPYWSHDYLTTGRSRWPGVGS